MTTQALTQKDQKIKELEYRMQEIQKREQSLASHAENLEMRTLSQGRNFQPTQNDVVM